MTIVRVELKPMPDPSPDKYPLPCVASWNQDAVIVCWDVDHVDTLWEAMGMNKPSMTLMLCVAPPYCAYTRSAAEAHEFFANPEFIARRANAPP